MKTKHYRNIELMSVASKQLFELAQVLGVSQVRAVQFCLHHTFGIDTLQAAYRTKLIIQPARVVAIPFDANKLSELKKKLPNIDATFSSVVRQSIRLTYNEISSEDLKSNLKTKFKSWANKKS